TFSLFPEYAPIGIGVGALSPLLAMAAGRVHLFISEAKSRRIEEMADRVSERLAKEGTDGKREAMKDVFIAAIPIIADAETEEKRRMIED
uniref:hypothetical protein n=1 Tax=Salmonella sp. SAL4432 TaxID=3159887 RepID=UPI00397E8938